MASLDTLYICSKCGATQVRKAGAIYTANVPTHCNLVMLARQVQPISEQPYQLYLFDFNGTLAETKSGKTFPQTVDDVMWMQGRLSRLQAIREAGRKSAMITNQGGAPWGIFTIEAMEAQLKLFVDEGGLDAYYVCYHDTSAKARERAKIKALTVPDLYKGVSRRKPEPGMLLEALDSFQVQPTAVLMVGDRPEDEAAAQAAGVAFMWAWDFFGDERPAGEQEL